MPLNNCFYDLLASFSQTLSNSAPVFIPAIHQWCHALHYTDPDEWQQQRWGEWPHHCPWLPKICADITVHEPHSCHEPWSLRHVTGTTQTLSPNWPGMLHTAKMRSQTALHQTNYPWNDFSCTRKKSQIFWGREKYTERKTCHAI